LFWLFARGAVAVCCRRHSDLPLRWADLFCLCRLLSCSSFFRFGLYCHTEFVAFSLLRFTPPNPLDNFSALSNHSMRLSSHSLSVHRSPSTPFTVLWSLVIVFNRRLLVTADSLSTPDFVCSLFAHLCQFLLPPHPLLDSPSETPTLSTQSVSESTNPICIDLLNSDFSSQSQPTSMSTSIQTVWSVRFCRSVCLPLFSNSTISIFVPARSLLIWSSLFLLVSISLAISDSTNLILDLPTSSFAARRRLLNCSRPPRLKICWYYSTQLWSTP